MFKLRYKIGILVLFISLLLVGTVGVFSFITADSHLNDVVNYKFMGQLKLIANNITLSLEPVERDLKFLSRVPAIQGMIRARAGNGFDPVGKSSYKQWKERLQVIFVEIAKAQACYMQLRFIENSGTELVRVNYDGTRARIVPENELQNKSSRYYFKETIKKRPGEIFISRIDLNRENGKIEIPYRPTIRFATPVFDAKGNRRGMVVINMMGDYFLHIRPMCDHGNNGFVFITDQDGFYLYHGRDQARQWGGPNDLNTGKSLARDYPDAALKILAGEKDRFLEGRREIFVLPLKVSCQLSFFIGIDMPLKVVNAPFYKFSYFLIFLLAGLLILTGVVSVLFSRWMLKPVQALREGTYKVSRGDYEHRLGIISNDEIQDLADDFNTMILSLKNKTARLDRLYEVGTTTVQNAEEAADMIASAVAKTLNMEMSGVEKIDGDQIFLVSLYRNGRILNKKILALEGSPCAAVMKEKKLCHYHNVAEKFPGYTLLQKHSLNTYYGVPVLSGRNKVIGILTVMDGRHINLSKEDIELLYILARRIAFEWEMEEKISQIKKANMALEVLYKIAFTIMHSIELEELLNTTLDAILAIDYLPLRKEAAIFLVDEKKHEIVLSAHRGFSEDAVRYDQRVKLGECLCGRAALSGEFLFSPNSEKNPYHTRKIPNMGTHSDICVPLKSKNKVLGILHVYLGADINLKKDDRSLFETVGDQLGVAIENALLFKTVHDHSEKLEREVEERTREIRITNKNLERANQAKSDFLASMSHELRTPLNAIIGFSEVLKDKYFGKLNEKQTEYVQDIFESGKHLLALINDILDLSKVEAGKMELEYSMVKLSNLLENSLIMVREKALKHGISLDIHIPDELKDLEIKADERKLKQILFNLLSNAAKFTLDGGAIEVEVRREGDKIVFSVLDTGIGIASKDLENIFNEFYQARGSITDKTPGTGLGLPLSRRLVEMHGGKIWAESAGEGKGSRFIFMLPVKPVSSDVEIFKTENTTSLTKMERKEILLDSVNKQIDLALKHDSNFTLCRMVIDVEKFEEKFENIINTLEKAKRGDDLIYMDIKKNTIYLILRKIDRKRADDVCNRFVKKLKSAFNTSNISCFLAVFPDDAESAEALIKKVD